MATEHYDVVIIGSGAGGGTLAWKLAPTGKRILLLERGDYLPRERDNWDTDAVFLRGKYTTDRDVASTPTATSSRPSRTTTSAATRSSTAPRCSGCGPRTSARSRTTAASRRRGRSATTTSSRGTPRPSSSTSCTAPPARTRPTARAAAPYPYPAVQHEPRIQQLHDDLEKLGLHPSHLPIGVMLDQDEHGDAVAHEPVHPLRSRRRLPVPRRRQGRRADRVRRPGARAPERRPHDQRAASSGSRPTPAGGRSPRWSRRSADGTEARVSGDVVVVSCGALELGAAAAALGQRRAPATGWPTAPTRSAATTCATTTWR